MGENKNLMSDRIKQKRLELGLTQEELGKILGVQRAAINKYESGAVENIKRSVIKKMCDTFNVDPSWIMAMDTPEEQDTNYVPHPKSGVHEYTFFDIGISAGSLENVEAILEGGDYDTMTLSDELMGKYAGRDSILILRVNGDSMNKIIPDKSYIAVDTTKTTVSDVSDKDIVVFSYDGEYSVKRYVHDRAGGRFLFKPESTYDTFSDIVITYENATELKLIGKVVRYLVPLD